MHKKLIGKQLRQIRKKRKLTQNEVASLLGITRAAYSHIENDRNELNISALIQLADLFNISIDSLLGITTKHKITEVELDKIFFNNITIKFNDTKLDSKDSQQIYNLISQYFWKKEQQ
ncbi:helix-turn-helix domain-containing protein [Vagococcus fessus]|uniref:HTH cro/C1-type domain-containing protein n=1 Tax=Vagococcus fessus TaxID=120370 RepID=A0A430ACN0_9ENTE|nr:helix-turn-helix transcriptional regulator [Vagococcus fessus]RSU04958.1 hypothetical protein CBF31_02750 [Vagococcus fessus]